MTVSFRASRGVWSYDFRMNGQRYAGYCTHPETGEKAKNRREAAMIESLFREQARKNQPQLRSAGGFTLAEALAHFLENEKNGTEFSTYRGYVRELLEHLGTETPLQDLDMRLPGYIEWSKAQPVTTFIGRDEQGNIKRKIHPTKKRTPRTINRALDCLKRACKNFKNDPLNKKIRHMIPDPPEFSYVKGPKRVPTPIRRDAGDKIVEQFDDFRNEHLLVGFLLCYHGGLRRSECVQVRDRLYDARERLLYLPPEITKTDTGRYVYINEIAHEAILKARIRGNQLWASLEQDPGQKQFYAQEWGIHERGDIPLVLYQPEGAGRLPRPVKSLAGYGWKRARKNANVRARWHDTRAGFCTNMLSSGANLQVVKQAAGHTNIATTEKYLAAANAEIRAAVEQSGKVNPVGREKSQPRLTTV